MHIREALEQIAHFFFWLYIINYIKLLKHVHIFYKNTREKRISQSVEKYLCIHINEHTITGNNNEYMLFIAIDKIKFSSTCHVAF